MFKSIIKHLKGNRQAYVVGLTVALLSIGLASYTPGQDFYSDESAWIKASALETPAAQTYTRAEFVLDVLARMQKGECYVDYCADMKGGMPEEKARCNLEKRGVFDTKAGYKWYEESLSRAEAIKVVVKAFGVRMSDNTRIPYTDVAAKAWYTPYVKAAYKGKLVGRMINNLFRPDNEATQKWVKGVLKKTKLQRLCEITPSI